MTAREVAAQALGIVERFAKAGLDPGQMADVLHVAGALVQTRAAAALREQQRPRNVEDE